MTRRCAADNGSTGGIHWQTALRDNGWFVSLVLVCFVIDLAKHAWLMTAGPVQPWPDSAYYWHLGQDAASGDFWLWGSGTASRTPLYPWFLGLCQWLAGRRAVWFAVLFQHALELAVSLLTAAIVWETTKSRRAALAAYLLCLPLTARCLFANTLLTESGATFLLALLMWLCSRAITNGHGRPLMLAALTLGVSLLLRPSAAAYLPAVLLAAWLSPMNSVATSRRVMRVLAVLGFCAVVIAPWCLRNQLRWHRPSLTVFLGRELWTATFSPWTGANLELPATRNSRRMLTLIDDSRINLRHNWSVYPALTRAGLTEVEADDLMKQVSLEAIERQPARAAVHAGARMLSFWYVKDWELVEAEYPTQEPWKDQLGWSSPARTEALRNALRLTPERNFRLVWLWSAATGCGLIGMLLFTSYRKAGVFLASLLLGLTLLTALLEIPCYRYRCVLEPVTIAAITVGARGWWQFYKSRRTLLPEVAESTLL